MLSFCFRYSFNRSLRKNIIWSRSYLRLSPLLCALPYLPLSTSPITDQQFTSKKVRMSLYGGPSEYILSCYIYVRFSILYGTQCTCIFHSCYKKFSVMVIRLPLSQLSYQNRFLIKMFSHHRTVRQSQGNRRGPREGPA